MESNNKKTHFENFFNRKIIYTNQEAIQANVESNNSRNIFFENFLCLKNPIFTKYFLLKIFFRRK